MSIDGITDGIMITCLAVAGPWDVTISPLAWRTVPTRMEARKLLVERFCI